MKKVLLVIVAALMALCAVACSCAETEEPGGKAEIALSGVSDKSLHYGDVFDPYQGVTAEGTASQIIIEGVEELKLDAESKVRGIGVFPLRYYIVIDGAVKAQKYSFVTVTYTEDAILKNGKFEAGGLLWETENATAVYSGGALLTISDSSKPAALKQGGLSLEKNKNYKVAFSASGSDALEVGLFSDGEDLKKGFDTVFALSAGYADYELTFRNTVDAPATGIVFSSNVSFSIKNISVTKVNISGDTEAPVFIGVGDKALLSGSVFDYTSGVTVSDNRDGNLTNDYSVILPKGVTVVGTLVSFPSDGVYEFIYVCEDIEGNTAKVARKVTVAPTFPGNYELIANGGFDSGMSSWYSDAWEGADASFKVVNGIMEIDISTLPTAQFSPFPRLISGNVPGGVSNRGLIVEKGAQYQLSFKIKADAARQFSIICGEILEESPWTNHFANFSNFDVTTEFQTVTRTFTMSGATNHNGALAFCFGNIGTDPVATKFYLDDISLIKK